jgi:hypothetical protein
MSDPLTTSDDRTRTGEFYFRVSRQDGEAWHWQMRIEALGTGEWGTFDSMQEALWFIRQHLTVEGTRRLTRLWRATTPICRWRSRVVRTTGLISSMPLAEE